MNVDDRYPALSSLAQCQGCTLNALGKGSQRVDNKYLRLNDCCDMVLNDSPRWSVDPYHYLATLDEFAKRLQGDDSVRRKIWDKLVGGSPVGGGPSVFLDTVAEAAWYLYFLDSGQSPVLEEPFDPSNPNSKDADIVLTLNGTKCWLDVLNVDFNGGSLPSANPNTSFIGRPTREDIEAQLVKRATKKYDTKFKDAVKTGHLQNASVGILLCLMKSEPKIISSFFVDLENGTELPPPTNLFGDRRPKFWLVWVNTLRPRLNSDVLQPLPILTWVNNRSRH